MPVAHAIVKSMEKKPHSNSMWGGEENELLNYFYNSLLNIKLPAYYKHWVSFLIVLQPCLLQGQYFKFTFNLFSIWFYCLHFKSWPILNVDHSRRVCFGFPEKPFVLETTRVFNYSPKCSCTFWERERPKTKAPSEPDPSLNNAEFMPVTMWHLCQSQWLDNQCSTT